jgi:hypothetical protein
MCVPTAAGAQLPDTILYSIPSPPSALIDTRFGANVAVDGAYIVVGVPGDDAPFRDSGTVKVYDSGTGELRFVIPSPTPASIRNDDLFGSVVAISGSRVVVGVPRYRLPSPDYENLGIVFVYDLSSATPTVPVATLGNPLPGKAVLGVDFGAAVAISGTRVVVGAPGDDTRGQNAGVAFVYDLSPSNPNTGVVTLFGPNPEAGDRFGASVAIFGSLVVVGAPTGSATTGRAFLYDVASATPAVSYAGLVNPDPVAGDQFAESLSMSGTRVLVGAPGDSTGAAAAGSAYLFEVAGLTTDTPNPVTTFRNPAPAPGDRFGAAVGIGDGKVVIGAAADDAGGTDSGIAYLYFAESPTPFAFLRNPRPAAGDAFGSAVAIAATGVVVGAPADDLVATDAGDAYFYPLDGTSFDFPRRTLNDSGQPFGAGFGTSVAIAKGGFFARPAIAVGAPFDHAGARESGRAFLYYFGSTSGSGWGSPSPNVGDHFGSAAAIGSYLASSDFWVGAPSEDTTSANVGAAYRYNFLIPGRPIPPSLVADPNASANDHFGNAMAADGSTNVIAAFRAAGGGKVFVSTRSLVLNNPGGPGDDFGFSVGVSGSRVIVGAPGEDTGASNAGSAYLYDTTAATPETPATILRNPDSAGGDAFGTSVAVSGRYAVVGAPNDDTGCADAGSAYVFDLVGTSPTVPIAVLRNPAPNVGAKFGQAVEIEGTIVAVGAPDDLAIVRDGGVVFLFDLASSTPSVPVATLRPPAPSDRHRFGYSLAMAGENLVVGAPWEGHNGVVHVFGPDTAGPTGGTLTLFAPEPVDPGAWTCVFFDDWKDPNPPLTYVVLIDDVPVNAPTTGTTIHFAVPTTPGVHRLTGCIFDARGNVTEVPRTFTVKGDLPVAAQVFASPGTSAGLVGEDGTQGYLQATIQRTGAVSARIVYEGKAYALSGKLDATGALTRSIARAGKPPLQVTLRANWFGQSGVVTADVTDGSKVSAALLKRSAFTAAQPVPEAGRYTVLIEAEGASLADASEQPVGSGSGIVVVAATGRIGFVGRLADGTRVSQATWLSESGTWPLYIPLHGGAGAVSGNVTFRDRPDLTDLDGGLIWQRPALSQARFYRKGFTTRVALGGSRFSALPAAFTQQQLEATLREGNLPTPRTARVPAFARNVTRNGDLVLSVDASNGLLTGSFLHPVTRTRQPIFGAVLSKLGMAGGYFPGKAETGRFELTD